MLMFGLRALTSSWVQIVIVSAAASHCAGEVLLPLSRGLFSASSIFSFYHLIGALFWSRKSWSLTLRGIFWRNWNAHFGGFNPLKMEPEELSCKRHWRNSPKHLHRNNWQGATCFCCKYVSCSWLLPKLILGCIKRWEDEYSFIYHGDCWEALSILISFAIHHWTKWFCSFFCGAAWTNQCFCGALDAHIADSIKRQCVSLRKFWTFMNCFF